MVAGGVSKFGVGKLIFCIGNVDSYAYKQAIEFYKKDIQHLSKNNNQLFFQQDNAPPHTSQEIKKILQNIKSLKFWPPNSPEISPIEKVWSFVLRKLEGKNIKDLDSLKKEVLYIWNRIPISYCEKIIDKFNSDIKKLMKSQGGIVKSEAKSSYKPYNLSERHYEDSIDNIIYNKETMKLNIKKKKKAVNILLSKKRGNLRKIETKEFSKVVLNEIIQKYVEVQKKVILETLKEEIKPFKEEIISLEEDLKSLNLSLDECFQKLNQKEKEKMINITSNLVSKSELTTVEEDDPIIQKINEIIERPFKRQLERIKRQKDLIRNDIKKLIIKKIETKRKVKKLKRINELRLINKIIILKLKTIYYIIQLNNLNLNLNF